MLDRYAACFQGLRAQREGAFVPFLVLGDPDPETSFQLLKALLAGGADMLELGIPFSDPVADGPVIQAASQRALAAGVTPAAALDIVARLRETQDRVPIGLLLYANLVHRVGPGPFFARAGKAGVDSVLVADGPPEMIADWETQSRARGVAFVRLVTPLTGEARLKQTLRHRGPYLYVVSRVGVTGRDRSLAASAGPLLKRIRRQGEVPTLLGFGIGRPAQVREAMVLGADGAICGSAAVEIVQRHAENAGAALGRRRLSALLREMQDFVSTMKRATRG